MPQTSFSDTEFGLISVVSDNSLRTLTAAGTYEDVTGTSITWTVDPARNYLYLINMGWKGVTNNFVNHIVRVLVDGATTGVNPTTFTLFNEGTSVANARFSSTAFFFITGATIGGGSHTVKLQTNDNSSGQDRDFYNTVAMLFGF